MQIFFGLTVISLMEIQTKSVLAWETRPSEIDLDGPAGPDGLWTFYIASAWTVYTLCTDRVDHWEHMYLSSHSPSSLLTLKTPD